MRDALVSCVWQADSTVGAQEGAFLYERGTHVGRAQDQPRWGSGHGGHVSFHKCLSPGNRKVHRKGSGV